MKVPFDSLCLAAALKEMVGWHGAKVQRVVQLDPHTLGIELYAGRVGTLVLSSDPERARVLAVEGKPAKGIEPGSLALELRHRLVASRFCSAEQVGLDRIAHLVFETPSGTFTIVAELMGKHTSLLLVGADGRLVASAKWLGRTKTRRPLLPGKSYEPPPLDPRPSLLQAETGDDLTTYEGVSPFLARWIQAAGEDGLKIVQEAYRTGRFQPSQAASGEAYPLPLDVFGIPAVSMQYYSEAAEEYFRQGQAEQETTRRRHQLIGQLRGVLRAREATLAQLEAARDTAARAAELQGIGQLLLAYSTQIEPGISEVELTDYDGVTRRVRIDPKLSPSENAELYFRKAKKAKHGRSEVEEQYARLQSDAVSLRSVITLAERATHLGEIEELEGEARNRRWTHSPQVSHANAKEDRPYEGKSIRELMAPGGWKVLYGTNSEANDYLTLRVAKPNDWWLHVRGGPSCHVVIQTSGQPLKVQREALEFAARVAARNSTSKHSGIVAVDYTLKKYVRRPKGAAAGLASYTHEKTLHVHPQTSD